MSWLRRFLRDPTEDRHAEMEAVQQKFESFLGLRDANKRVLAVIADMGEKPRGEDRLDSSSARAGLAAAREGIADVIEKMVAFGGEPYATLRGRCSVIDGEIEDALEDGPEVPGRVLAKIAPLNILHPDAPEFQPDECRTLHDIARFTHQKAMEEMLSGAMAVGRQRGFGLRLKTKLPLEVRLIDMDRPASEQDGKRRITVDEIGSVPMKAFWKGVEEEGWPAHARPVNLSGFVSVVTTQMGTASREDFAEASFALLSERYMLLSLHLGYHFTTFEAMCTPEPDKSYIRMQFKGGGASADRRIRRIGLVMDLLSNLGFEHASKADFLDASVSCAEEASIAERLRLLGRLTMLTKQLDMALSNDKIVQWYAGDFARKLGLESDSMRSEEPPGTAGR